MRIFAGPNGSGKTSIISAIRDTIPFGVYVNADDLEHTLTIKNTLDFNNFKLQVSQCQLRKYFKKSTFSPFKRREPDLWEKIHVVENILSVQSKVDSYLAADLAEFIRQSLLDSEQSFTYETVMSHESKIDFLTEARRRGYRVYLYYVCTEDPEINISRVALRVRQNGHSVPPEVVRARYFKSLEQLWKAVQNSDRAYLWDNSKDTSQLLGEVVNGSELLLIDPGEVTAWLTRYLIKESAKR